MRKIPVLVGLLVGTIGLSFVIQGTAQTYNARGTFNGWGETPMNDDGDGTYSLTLSGLTPGERHNFKIATNGWATSWPGSDARSLADAAGNLTLHFLPGEAADGWQPAANRVGYADPGQFGWEIMGTFNGWNDLTDSAARQMTNQGGGLYSVDYTIATATTHEFKFRESNSWDISIGDDLGNSAANLTVTTTETNTPVRFELDLPNGRWRTMIIPEAFTPDLLGIGGLANGADLVLRWSSESGTSYRVSATFDPVSGPWGVLASNLVATASEMVYSNSTAVFDSEIYRVEEE